MIYGYYEIVENNGILLKANISWTYIVRKLI
jgi:hypothetical protein